MEVSFGVLCLSACLLVGSAIHAMLKVNLDGFAGDPEIIKAVVEARRCIQQMRAEPVRRAPQQVHILLERIKVLCARLTRAAKKGAHAFLPSATYKRSAQSGGVGRCNERWRCAAQWLSASIPALWLMPIVFQQCAWLA